jgi:hypothetical protein
VQSGEEDTCTVKEKGWRRRGRNAKMQSEWIRVWDRINK